jgi:AraC family transcriptional activator of pobA
MPMDAGRKGLDNPNMDQPREAIPVYALYGEQSPYAFEDRLHWETLVSRSQLHDFRIAPHRHEQLFQLLHVTGGEARVTLDGRTVTLQPPALVVVPALTVHGYAFSRDIEGVVLTLFERDVRAALASAPDCAEVLEEPEVFTGCNILNVFAANLDALIEESGRRGPGQKLALWARVELLLAEVVRLAAAREHAPAAQAARAVQHAQHFQRLVEEDYRRHRPVDFYASALGITAPHLNRIAEAVLGASALTVIERRLMLEARRYLMFSAMSVKQIALALGYEDPAYFNRVFRRQMGVPPGRYRMEHRDWSRD